MTKQWDKYRGVITAEYKDQNKPLHEVQRFMTQKYGFRASTRAYRSRFDRWGIHKYSRRQRSRSRSHSPSQRDSASDSGSNSGSGSENSGNGNIHPSPRQMSPDVLDSSSSNGSGGSQANTPPPMVAVTAMPTAEMLSPTGLCAATTSAGFRSVLCLTTKQAPSPSAPDFSYLPVTASHSSASAVSVNAGHNTHSPRFPLNQHHHHYNHSPNHNHHYHSSHNHHHAYGMAASFNPSAHDPMSSCYPQSSNSVSVYRQDLRDLRGVMMMASEMGGTDHHQGGGVPMAGMSSGYGYPFELLSGRE